MPSMRTDSYSKVFSLVSLLNEAHSWVGEPWCIDQVRVLDGLQIVIIKIADIINSHRAQQIEDHLIIDMRLHYAFDREGNRQPFRRVDVLNALAKWYFLVSIMCADEITEADVEEVKRSVEDVNQALLQQEIDDCGRLLGTKPVLCTFSR